MLLLQEEVAGALRLVVSRCDAHHTVIHLLYVVVLGGVSGGGDVASRDLGATIAQARHLLGEHDVISDVTCVISEAREAFKRGHARASLARSEIAAVSPVSEIFHLVV